MNTLLNWTEVPARTRSELWHAQQETLLCASTAHAMSWLFPPNGGFTPPQSILEIGCGRGAWLRAMTQLSHPRLAIGVDTERQAIVSAKKLVPTEEATRTLFMRCSPHMLPELAFTMNTFDAIRLSLPLESWLAVPVAPLLSSLYDFCRPSGVITWHMTEFPFVTSASPAFSQLCEIIRQGLYIWHSCPEQELFLEDHYAIPTRGKEPTTIEWMQSWLDALGFEQIHARSGEICISSGSPLHSLFKARLERVLGHAGPWLQRRGILKAWEWHQLCLSVWAEVRTPQFAAHLPIVNVWGTKHARPVLT
jgi:SAM-dependent methyltransferase